MFYKYFFIFANLGPYAMLSLLQVTVELFQSSPGFYLSRPHKSIVLELSMREVL